MAHALDLVGERWTLLIVRDLLFGPLRFTDLRDGLPGLAPNLLSDRLRWLGQEGVVERVELPPPAARTVYALTDAGRDLGPVVHTLAQFGMAHGRLAMDRQPPRRLLRGALLALMHPDRVGDTGWTATVDLPEGVVALSVAPRQVGHSALSRLHLTDLADGSPPPADVSLATTLGALVDIRRGRSSVGQAAREGRVRVEGAPEVVAEMYRLFAW